MTKALERAANTALSFGPFLITRIGLVVKRKPTEEEWGELFSRLNGVEDAYRWAFGDALKTVEIEYKEAASQMTAAYPEYEYDALRNFRWVADKVEFATRVANLSWTHHREVAKLEAADQKKWLTKAEAKGWTVRELRQAIRGATLEEPPEPPEGQFSVVIVDPPWPIEKIEREVRPNQVLMDYPTMPLEQIASLSIPAADNTHVFLWTTQRFLPSAIEIIGGWGASYVCTFVWHKPGGFQPVGLPQYNCEFVVYGRIGSPKFRETTAFPVCFSAGRGSHSEKPAEFYEMVRRVTSGKRKDMFARKRHEGYEAWGNEVLP